MHSLDSPLKIGILGSLSPIGSVEFHRRLLLAWAKATPCMAPEAYPRIVHLTLPLSRDEVQDLAPGSLVKFEDELTHVLDTCNVVAVPCPELQPVLPQLQALLGEHVYTPLQCAPKPVHPILLASSSKFCQSVEGYPFVIPAPSEQRYLDACIAAISCGCKVPAQEFATFLHSLVDIYNLPVQMASAELSSVGVLAQAGVHDAMDELVNLCVQFRLGPPRRPDLGV